MESQRVGHGYATFTFFHFRSRGKKSEWVGGVCVCERERENILMYAFNKSQFSIIYASSGHQVYGKNKA